MLARKKQVLVSNKACEAGTAPSASDRSIGDAAYVRQHGWSVDWWGGAVNNNRQAFHRKPAKQEPQILIKQYYVILRRFRGLQMAGVEDRSFPVILRNELVADLRRDIQPLLLFQLIRIFGMADKTDEADIIDTAGHGVAPGNKAVVRESGRYHDLPLEVDILSLITLF